MRHLIIVGMLIFFTGCSSAWIIRRDQEGGIIGYKGFSDGQSALEAVSKLIQCPNYEMVSDSLNGQQFSYQTYTPVTIYGQNSGSVSNQYGQRVGTYSSDNHYTAYVPQTNTGTSYWREFVYKCKSASLPTSSQLQEPKNKTSYGG